MMAVMAFALVTFNAYVSGFCNGAKVYLRQFDRWETEHRRRSKDSSGSEDAKIELDAGGTRDLKGDNFDPAQRTLHTYHLRMRSINLYQTQLNVEDCSYVTSSCTVISHTIIECFSSRSKAGCKRKQLRWRVTIEDHSSDFSDAAINFKKANISDIVSPNKYSLNTEGGQEILLNVSDFGSLNET